jgi:hypothetical protein
MQCSVNCKRSDWDGDIAEAEISRDIQSMQLESALYERNRSDFEDRATTS